MAQLLYRVDVRVNSGRMNAMKQALVGRLKRASRNDRPAVLHRGSVEIVEKCMKFYFGGRDG